MKGTQRAVILLICIYFSIIGSAHGGFLDSLSETISEAGDAVSEAGNKVIDSAKELGEETGVIEKDEEITTTNATNTGNLDCEQFAAKFKELTRGDNALLPYAEAEDAMVTKWSGLYQKAKPLLNSYSQQFSDGSCSNGDSHRKFLMVKISDFEAMYPESAKNPDTESASNSESVSNKGKFVFSTQPISPNDSSGITDSFNTGDHIYGLVQVKKPWNSLYNKKNNFYVRVDVKVDGKQSVNGEKIHAQFITFKSEVYAKRDYLIFNVAPEVAKLIVYSDPNLMYGQTTAVIKQGPNELSYHLGRLSPGKHTISFEIQNYGKIFAKGNFIISGDSFEYYSDLHEQIATGVVAARTFPQAKATNKSLKKEMETLLLSAGWKNVYRLNIVDKDWWIMRSNGGNSAIVGRYMDAAALTEDPKGKYYYKKCSFQQDKLLSGGYGPLFISKQGDAVPITKENIDK